MRFSLSAGSWFAPSVNVLAQGGLSESHLVGTGISHIAKGVSLTVLTVPALLYHTRENQ